ncbi:phosphate system positive regulatory protein pho81 [Malassezia cuniculi]|uniref:Phosphate system positive regulatory protein pho81 n=1 Tax=Malassezia cuniculi TaxID=948313 RepID=A0AAF0JCQ4_9BASI|nr:phosphate system positive regulatory protein pho81 [Malassezia cuniculi]
MKFGKQILSQQISGWGSYYLDYKFLKKIINSLEKGRLGDAALFATGSRPEPGDTASPLHTESPASELQIHKAAFFFKLERELEKINAFYLQRESDLRLRLTTLLTKKRALIQSANGRSTGQNTSISRDSPSFIALIEGFRYFEKDLGKLQQFIEVNATGFRKILKKWDKRSKSQTKELYLARQVEVQPCFNRAFIAEMSDAVAASILQLESLADGRELPASMYKSEATILASALPMSATNLPGSVFLDDDGAIFASEQRLEFNEHPSRVLAALEERIVGALRAGDVDATKEVLRDAHKEEAAGDTSGREVAAAHDAAAPANSGIARLVWRTLVDVPQPALERMLAAGIPDFSFVDDINARTSLHISSIAGQLMLVKACVDHGVDVRARDVYGREALAYAAIHGHDEICHYLLALPQSHTGERSIVESVDLDGFSPLVHSVFRGHTNTVRILLDHVSSASAPDGAELVPLAIACQHGHAEITRLLLERGARMQPNTEGLLPLALAARAGHAECVKLLLDAKADVDATEKSTLWTALFFAAENGHAKCLQLLLDAGAQPNHLDEKQCPAVFYAAWHGWMSCVSLLVAAAPARPALSRDSPEAEPELEMDGEVDGIPSLYLPPPIIPFRTYGHNYLDKRSLVMLSLSNRSITLQRQHTSDRPDTFPGLSASLKLVLTPRNARAGADAGIPHTIILPMAEDREDVTFQTEDLEHFSIECEIFPTFGSSRIAKTVLLPDVLLNAHNRSALQLPLFDWHLGVVGQITTAVEYVRPFESVQLEIGGRVETYWKSMLPSASGASAPSSASIRRGPGGGTPPGPQPNDDGSGAPSYVTASSLAGTYVQAPVQFTADGQPVVWPHETLPGDVFSPRVGQVTLAQFNEIAMRTGRTWHVQEGASALKADDWHEALDRSPVPLDRLLETLPHNVALALDIRYTEPSLALSDCVDAVLHAVYSAADREHAPSRSLIFSSANPSACVALNWKQPNYAVFFICRSTLAADSSSAHLPLESDPRQSSLAEAVRFAKGNNLIGLMADGPLLARVPELVSTIKGAGLVLISLDRVAPIPNSHAVPPHGFLGTPALDLNDSAFDGYVQDGVIRYQS